MPVVELQQQFETDPADTEIDHPLTNFETWKAWSDIKLAPDSPYDKQKLLAMLLKREAEFRYTELGELFVHTEAASVSAYFLDKGQLYELVEKRGIIQPENTIYQALLGAPDAVMS